MPCILPSARLAQSAERKALNLVVVGSSPTVGVSLLVDMNDISSLGRKALNTLWSWLRAPRWVFRWLQMRIVKWKQVVCTLKCHLQKDHKHWYHDAFPFRQVVLGLLMGTAHEVQTICPSAKLFIFQIRCGK